MSLKESPWVERPFLRDTVDQLLGHDWKHGREMMLNVAYELQFRRTISVEKKAEVFCGLIHSYEDEIAKLTKRLNDFKEKATPELPDIDFDTTIKQRRRLIFLSTDMEWHDVGLLSASGYRVGKTNGVPEDERRRILNHIFKVDDLSDIDDRSYAEEWGNPMTGDRLKKLVDSIASFTKNSKRKQTPAKIAIEEWEDDLAYLKRTFYDRWGNFPWPDVEV